MNRMSTLEDRFWAKVDASGGPDACWLWTAATTESGYGKIGGGGRGGKTWLAHRLSLVLAGADLIADLSVDHLCHNADLECRAGDLCIHRRCVNPQHLEQVPTLVNVRRGRGPSAKYKTHCVNGHEFAKHARISGSTRVCRICNAAAVARLKVRRLAARRAA